MLNPFIIASLALSGLAPTLKKYFANDQVQDVLGQIVTITQNLTGIRNDSSALINLLDRNPELLKELEAQITALLTERDRQYARERDLGLYQTTGRSNWRANFMLALAIIGLVAGIGVLITCHHHLNGEIIGIIATLIGIFCSVLKDIYAFEFGGSGREKDNLMLRTALQYLLTSNLRQLKRQPLSELTKLPPIK